MGHYRAARVEHLPPFARAYRPDVAGQVLRPEDQRLQAWIGPCDLGQVHDAARRFHQHDQADAARGQAVGPLGRANPIAGPAHGIGVLDLRDDDAVWPARERCGQVFGLQPRAGRVDAQPAFRRGRSPAPAASRRSCRALPVCGWRPRRLPCPGRHNPRPGSPPYGSCGDRLRAYRAERVEHAYQTTYFLKNMTVRSSFDHHRPVRLAPDVLQPHDAHVGPGTGQALVEDFALHVDGVAVEHRVRMDHLLIPQVSQDRALCQLGHGQPDHQAQGEDPIDDPLAEEGPGGIVFVQMQRLRVHGQCAEQHVVCLGHRAPLAVPDALPYFEIFVIQSGHLSAPSSSSTST